MSEDNYIISTTKINYELLCDVETILGLTCTMLMLKSCPRFVKVC